MATDDPILALEHQLVGAARRRAAYSRRRVGGAAVGVAAAVLVALAVAAGGLLLLGGRSRPDVAPSVSRPPSSSAQLVGLLAVLRRPQTAADRGPLPGIRPRRVSASLLEPDRRLARLAAVAPWGASIYLVPFSVSGVSRIAILVRGAVWRAANAARIERGRAVVQVPLGPRLGRLRPLRLVQVVPDGVSRVALMFAAGALIETVAVHGNTAAFEVAPRPTGRLALLWFGARGQTLKRIAFS